MRNVLWQIEPENEDQIFMFPDAPRVPLQPGLVLPMPEPVEPEPEPHPDLFLQPFPNATIEEEYPYYLLEGEEATGPFTTAEIQGRLQVGLLAPGTYAWNQGMSEWRTVAELFGVPPVAVPAPNLASFTVRFAAGFIDLAVIILAYFLLMIALPPFRDWIEASSLSTRGVIVSNVVLSLPVYAYFLVLLGPGGRGRTLGYRFLHIRLVGEATRQPLDWLQACLWCVASLTMIVGWPLFWLDPERRMLHNRLSKTIVVNDLP